MMARAKLAAALAVFLCSIPLARAFNPAEIKLPAGFKIALYAENLPQARSLALSEAPGPAVIVYVSSRGKGALPAQGTPDDKVWALVDSNGDGTVDFVTTVLQGYANPNGIAWRKGALYVGLPTTIMRLDNIDAYALQQKAYDKPPTVLLDSLPPDDWHGTKYLRFGPDGKLYFAVGINCNVCTPTRYRKDASSPSFLFGSIYRMNADGSGLQKWASGLRNSVGWDWQPDTKELFFTDNDNDDWDQWYPDDTLKHAPTKGLNFGFPYCLNVAKGGNEVRPRRRLPGIGKPIPYEPLNAGQANMTCSRKPNDKFKPATQALGPHVAVLGMRFYKWTASSMFPAEYDKSIFLALHGSSARTTTFPVGYNVMRLTLNSDNNTTKTYGPFASGWLKNPNSPPPPNGDAYATGRPVDVQQLPDGSLLVSDDFANCVYRITYNA